MQRVRIHETDGDIAEGVEFSDGFVVIRRPNPESRVHAFLNREALEGDEQFAGARFEWLDDGDPLGEAYKERARLVAFLASHYPSVLAYADPEEPDWAVVYVHTPAGQMSWHIAPGDVELFDHVQKVTPDDHLAQWDQHTTEEKYERLARMTRFSAITNWPMRNR